jgi:hypothetical protein
VLAAAAGIGALTDRWIDAIGARIRNEASFGILGAALARLIALQRGEAVLGAGELARLSSVIEACFDRGLWLFEGLRGENAPFDPAEVGAVRSLRDALRFAPAPLASSEARALALCERRIADRECPPSLRGAALGFVWSARSGESDDEARAVAALGAAARPASMGDFLGGLFVLARAEVSRASGLLRAIDHALQRFTDSDFFAGLPALRQAFSFFPPRERLGLAERLLAATGQSIHEASALLSTTDPAIAARGFEVDRAIDATIERFGLARKEPR